MRRIKQSGCCFRRTYSEADVRLFNADILATYATVTVQLLGREVKCEANLVVQHWGHNSSALLATTGVGAGANLDIVGGALKGLSTSFRRGKRFRAHILNTKMWSSLSTTPGM